MSRHIAVMLTLVVGVIITADFFIKWPVLNNLSKDIQSWMPIVTNFAVIVGSLNLVSVHQGNIRRKRPAWYNSVVLLFFMALTVYIGLTQGTSAKAYRFLFDNMLVACSSTMFAMTAFFIASSSYRAFRATNMEAAALLIAAGFVMIGQVPIGEAISQHFPTIGNWIMTVPNLAGQRGLLIATGVGFMAISLRIILGYSRGHLGAE